MWFERINDQTFFGVTGAALMHLGLIIAFVCAFRRVCVQTSAGWSGYASHYPVYISHPDSLFNSALRRSS